MISALLAIQAERRPCEVAVVFGARQLTYAALQQRACRAANALAAQGTVRGDRVGVLVHNCLQFFELLFACATLGAIFVPINFRLARAEVAQVLDACAPTVLMAGESFTELLEPLLLKPGFPPHLHWLDDHLPTASEVPDHPYERWLASQPPDPPVLLPPDTAELMLMHSSGTTGLPKGIVFTHATALASSQAKIIDFGLTPQDITVVFGPLFHAGPLFDLALPLLLRGGRVILGASLHFDPERLLSAIAEHRGTVIPIYPTMLRRVLATPPDPRLDLRSLRLIITGGEAAPLPVIEGTVKRFPQADFINNYGSTEGGPVTTFLAAGDGLRKKGSVGRESFSVEVRIVDEEGRRLEHGQVGELVVRSPFVCRGYWGRPAETADRLRDGWWWTGDLAWRDAEGFLWIAGRSKDMVKTGTENVYPIEVEQVIATLDEVVEVAVIGVPDEDWGEAVVAFVVAEAGSALTAEAVISHCRIHLASYKKPRHVRFVDSLPRGTTNKVVKQVLRDLWARDAGSRPDAAPPLSTN